MTTELDVTKYSSIPFEEKGRSMYGCDCWGIPYLMYQDLLGITLPLYHDRYDSTEDREELHALIEEQKLSWLQVDRPEPMDLVVLRLNARSTHIGVYIGNGKFIHCRTGAGTVVEKLTSSVWRDRVVGYHRYHR